MQLRVLSSVRTPSRLRLLMRGISERLLTEELGCHWNSRIVDSYSRAQAFSTSFIAAAWSEFLEAWKILKISKRSMIASTFSWDNARSRQWSRMEVTRALEQGSSAFKMRTMNGNGKSFTVVASKSWVPEERCQREASSDEMNSVWLRTVHCLLCNFHFRKFQSVYQCCER